MIVPKGHRNTYEEIPDQLKDLVDNGVDEKGQRPKSRASRDSLMRAHELHLKLLSEGNVPTRNLILPLPYRPSRASIWDESIEKVCRYRANSYHYTYRLHRSICRIFALG